MPADSSSNALLKNLWSPPAGTPELLQNACKVLPEALTAMTDSALDGARASVLGQGMGMGLLETELRKVSKGCNQIQIDASRMNPKWNKLYKDGHHHWSGGDPCDSVPRGGVPYFCPDGWVRFSLNVCKDDEFAEKFKDFGYAYHGTHPRNVGSILTSGFHAKHGCTCAPGQDRVYISPSIEYCAHPRYAKITYKPKIRKFVQCVLQCRVRKDHVCTVAQGTLPGAHEHDDGIDPNFHNNELEWLFAPDGQDETGLPIVKNAIVCTGIMLRLTDHHPSESNFWWSRNEEVMPKKLVLTPHMPRQWNSWGVQSEKITFMVPCSQTVEHLLDPHSRGDNMGLVEEWSGDAWIAPTPFAEGGMRVAYYAYFNNAYYVIKEFNKESLDQLLCDYKCSVRDAVAKDMRCVLLADAFALEFNKQIGGHGSSIRYNPPRMIKRGGRYYYAELAMDGNYQKFNNNAGWVDDSKSQAHHMAATFCHFTYQRTAGLAMVVDIQGVDLMWTDPQIHTNLMSKGDALCQRYSLGNNGRAGMKRFFVTHRCNDFCRKLNLVHPVQKRLDASRQRPALVPIAE